MPDPKDKQEVVVQDDDLENKTGKKDDDGIEIPLDENGELIPAETIKKQQEETEKQKEEEQRKRNAEFAQRRIDQDKQRLRQENEEMKRRLAELEKRSGVNSFGAVPQQTVKDKAYWEKRLADDPVSALDEYEDYKYTQRLKQQQEHQERQTMLTSWHTTLEESKTMAVEEFPSLATEGSPEYVMFMDILGKHPEWRNSPIGPMKVVKEMKKQMANGSAGDDVISKARAEAETNERNRQARIVNQPLSGSRKPAGNKIVLSKEQMTEWNNNFKDRGVTLESYALMVKRTQGENTEVAI